MKRRALEAEARSWWGTDSPPGIAIVLGAVSGGLQALDYDQPGYWDAWVQKVKEVDEVLLSRLPMVETPSGGHHVFFRQGNPLPRKIIASSKNREVAIELRGEGNYVIAPGSPATCHPSGKLYTRIQSTPPIQDAPILAPDEVDILISAARALNEYISTANIVQEPKTTNNNVSTNGGGGEMPGTSFNAQAKWMDILGPLGWVAQKTGRSGETLLSRPGKQKGVSASIGFCKTEIGGDLLYVFSSNASPFEADRAYSKFAAYALLNHQGNFDEAAKALAQNGYGGPPVDAIEAKIKTLKFPSGPPDMARLDLLREVEKKKFDRSWKRTRSDFKNPTANEYCISLANIARRYGWNDQEIVDLMVAWIRKEGEAEKPPEWYAKIVLLVEREQIADQATEDLVEGGDREKMIESLTKLFGFPITGFIQNCRENAVYSLITDRGELEIGTASQLMDESHVRSILYDQRDVMLKLIKKERWLSICANLKKICTLKNENEAIGSEDLLDWIERHIGMRSAVASDDSEEGWAVAVPRGLPFLKDGQLWVNAQTLLNTVHTVDDRMTRGRLLNRLRMVGFTPKVHTGSGRTKSYWGIDNEKLRLMREDLWSLLFDYRKVAPS